MSNGTIVQCIGAVVDIQFPRDQMPKIYEALTLADEGSSFAEKGLTLEVQQQLGDGVVRTIALGSSDGLRRALKVTGSGAPIPVPVAYHSFGGWKRSAFGDINQHGMEGVKFWTKVKTVTQRWPDGGAGDSAFIIPTMG